MKWKRQKRRLRRKKMKQQPMQQWILSLIRLKPMHQKAKQGILKKIKRKNNLPGYVLKNPFTCGRIFFCPFPDLTNIFVFKTKTITTMKSIQIILIAITVALSSCVPKRLLLEEQSKVRALQGDSTATHTG